MYSVRTRITHVVAKKFSAGCRFFFFFVFYLLSYFELEYRWCRRSPVTGRPELSHADKQIFWFGAMFDTNKARLLSFRSLMSKFNRSLWNYLSPRNKISRTNRNKDVMTASIPSAGHCLPGVWLKLEQKSSHGKLLMGVGKRRPVCRVRRRTFAFVLWT